MPTIRVELPAHLRTLGRIAGPEVALDVPAERFVPLIESTAYFVVVGIVDPLAVSLIWFDLLGTGMSRRSRVALIGYVGTAIGGLAALMLLPY